MTSYKVNNQLSNHLIINKALYKYTICTLYMQVYCGQQQKHNYKTSAYISFSTYWSTPTGGVIKYQLSRTRTVPVRYPNVRYISILYRVVSIHNRFKLMVCRQQSRWLSGYILFNTITGYCNVGFMFYSRLKPVDDKLEQWLMLAGVESVLPLCK